jgi:hypothetical protein
VNATLQVLLRLADALKVDLDLMFNYRWAALREAELRKRIKALADGADVERLWEMLALMRAREV